MLYLLPAITGPATSRCLLRGSVAVLVKSMEVDQGRLEVSWGPDAGLLGCRGISVKDPELWDMNPPSTQLILLYLYITAKGREWAS